MRGAVIWSMILVITAFSLGYLLTIHPSFVKSSLKAQAEAIAYSVAAELSTVAKSYQMGVLYVNKTTRIYIAPQSGKEVIISIKKIRDLPNGYKEYVVNVGITAGPGLYGTGRATFLSPIEIISPEEIYAGVIRIYLYQDSSGNFMIRIANVMQTEPPGTSGGGGSTGDNTSGG